jgi:hypothetical protein
MKINRRLANRIMTRALSQSDQCLVGIINSDESLLCSDNAPQINQLLQNNPQAVLIYNQSANASSIRQDILLHDGQQCIEIFQDIEGVFGLRAYQQCGKIQTPVILELNDE